MAKTCNGCNTETKEIAKVTMSSADWQRNEQRHEKREKIHWILEIILVALLLLSNFSWIVYESYFEKVITTGVVINGESENQVHEENNDQNP